MKTTYLLLSATLTMSTLLTGCVIAIDGDDHQALNNTQADKPLENRKKLATLIPNSNLNEIQELMGIADFYEAYKNKNDAVQILYYQTHHVIKDHIIDKNECTPLIFKNGRLESWGEKAKSLL